jgi:hypothetical protein
LLINQLEGLLKIKNKKFKKQKINLLNLLKNIDKLKSSLEADDVREETNALTVTSTNGCIVSF